MLKMSSNVKAKLINAEFRDADDTRLLAFMARISISFSSSAATE